VAGLGFSAQSWCRCGRAQHQHAQGLISDQDYRSMFGDIEVIKNFSEVLVAGVQRCLPRRPPARAYARALAARSGRVLSAG
jgi:hypothetical protein